MTNEPTPAERAAEARERAFAEGLARAREALEAAHDPTDREDA